jgi:hypothetical protein
MLSTEQQASSIMVRQSRFNIKDVCVGEGKHYCILEFLPKQRKGELRDRR